MSCEVRVREYVDHALKPIYVAKCSDHGSVGMKHWSKVLAIADAEAHSADTVGEQA